MASTRHCGIIDPTSASAASVCRRRARLVRCLTNCLMKISLSSAIHGLHFCPAGLIGSSVRTLVGLEDAVGVSVPPPSVLLAMGGGGVVLSLRHSQLRHAGVALAPCPAFLRAASGHGSCDACEPTPRRWATCARPVPSRQ